MSNYDTQNINVLNYNENMVCVNSAKDCYQFSASRDGETPSVVPMSLNELQYIASNTDIILTGWLTFDEDVKEEVYKDLRIADWKKILTNKDIEKILTSPDMDGLQKLLDITNQTYFDRVRIIMFKLMQDGVDITTKVSRIVEQRYDELRNKQRHSSIVLTKKDTKKFATPDDVKELSAQNDLLQNQLNEMKQMMAQMIAAQNANASTSFDEQEVSNSDKNEEPKASLPKKPGRPKKTT